MTDATFNTLVGKDVPALVEFYAPVRFCRPRVEGAGRPALCWGPAFRPAALNTKRPPPHTPPHPPPLPLPQWCGHCKNLAPDYAKLAATFKDSPSSVLIAKVDADAHKELATKFEVKGFPTIKWFPKGSLTPEDYEGGRSPAEMIDFVNAQTGLRKALVEPPSAVAALTPDTFDAVVGAPATFKLLEFYAPWCGHCKQLAPIYEQLGAVFEGEASVVIAKIDADKHRSLGERFGVSGFPTIKYLELDALDGGAKPEAAAKDYSGGRDLPALVEFVNSKAGTAKTAEGGLLPTAGRAPEMDALAAGYGAAPAGTRAERLASAKASADKRAALYAKVMEKIDEKGAGYVAGEAARVEKLLAKDDVTKAKKGELMLKKNVLAAFSEAAAAEAATAEGEL